MRRKTGNNRQGVKPGTRFSIPPEKRQTEASGHCSSPMFVEPMFVEPMFVEPMCDAGLAT